jgi:hypothetical protein
MKTLRTMSRDGRLRLTTPLLRGIAAAFFSFSTLLPCRAQIGSWQSHASYRAGQSVAGAGNKIYAATQNGFFYVDKTTRETVVLGKQQGLSDVGISRLLYLADQRRLLIAYRSGNLDFLTLSATGEPGTVQNINTIAVATSLPASRTINHLNRVGNNVYLSTDFGVVVLDVLRDELKDTYFSRRADGLPRPVFQTAATTDSLYALVAPLTLTESGRRIQAIRFLAGVNLADPGNWKTVAEPGPETESILTNQNRLSATVNGQGIYERQAGRWSRVQPLTNTLIRQFTGATAGPVLATSQAVTVPGSGTFTGPLLTNPREVIVDENRVWVADGQTGLLAGNAGSFQPIAPAGPLQDQFSRLYAYQNQLIALPNGPQQATPLDAGQPPADVYGVAEDQWQPILRLGLTSGFNAAAYLPTDQRLYLSSYGNGLFSQTDGQAPVPIALPATISPFISSLAPDNDGNLWMTTAGPNLRLATLHVRRPEGTFQSFSDIIRYPATLQVVPDDNGFLWLRLEGDAGLQVFDPATNRNRLLGPGVGLGNLLTTTVQALVKDRTGAIWIGTDLGPMVFDDPGGVFDRSPDAQAPLLNRRRLLANEVVTSMAVDGSNRKWIGTQTGLYYVAPDGSQLLDSFTASNSPLPGNTVQALAVEPVSGRVFVQTSTAGRANGLVSYRGPATEPAEQLSNLTIFPNPVRPDFTGTVGINGLSDNATVKILDAGGLLVYETRSQGGTATWNLRDYRNRPAQTGVYLVVVVTADGVQGLAGKLAVVR